MDRERWQRLKSILDDALEREGSDRAAFVDRCCAQEPELAAELRSLLEAADSGAMDDATLPALELTSPTAVGGTADIPERIGPYRILSKLGEGGMGVVYEAEQASPKRRVAVKIVRGGQFVDEQRVRLFQREADTLARLKHPNIGAIYESGRTEDGQHFFAMELVRGETLDAYIGKRPPVVDVEELRFRLSLFRTIADAVHYAHQRGVIHRDLKPSNIVVTEESAVKILDFGLARITEGDVTAATMVTEIGVIKGTLAYMSPEQARGNPEEIDLRSDVYALGVILYQMISGSRPYDVANRALVEAVRVICEEPPRPLRQSWSGRKQLDPDVETIVGRALDKDAGRRYSSAAALSEDVARYLTSQPILARPPSAIYQLRKFAKRNKTLVGGIVATFAVLVAGIVVSATLGLREARQRREAVAAREDLQTVVDFQSRMLREVDPQQMGRALLEDIKRRAAAAMHEAGIGKADAGAELASLARSLDRINPTDAALRVLDEDVLDRAARSIDERFLDQPLIEGRLRSSLGWTYFELGFLAKGEEQMLRAWEVQREALGPEHRDTLNSRLYLSVFYERQGRLPESERLAREVYGIARRVHGEGHTFTLMVLNRLAIAYDVQERLDEALEAYQVVYEQIRKQLGDDHPEAIWALHNIGSLYRRQGRFDEAEPLLVEAGERFQRVRGDEHRDTLWAMESLAFVYHDQGRLDEAERLSRDTLDKRRRLLGDEHNKTLVSADTLAGIYRDQGRLDEAEALYRDTLEKRRRTIGDGHWLTLWTIQGFAETKSKQGRFEEAAALYEELFHARKRSAGEAAGHTLWASLWLSATYRKLGRHGDAEALLQPTLDAQMEAANGDGRAIGRAHAELGILKATRGEREAAIEHMRQAIGAGEAAVVREALRDPDLAGLRGVPAFETLVAELGGT